MKHQHRARWISAGVLTLWGACALPTLPLLGQYAPQALFLLYTAVLLVTTLYSVELPSGPRVPFELIVLLPAAARFEQPALVLWWGAVLPLVSTALRRRPLTLLRLGTWARLALAAGVAAVGERFLLRTTTEATALTELAAFYGGLGLFFLVDGAGTLLIGTADAGAGRLGGWRRYGIVVLFLLAASPLAILMRDLSATRFPARSLLLGLVPLGVTAYTLRLYLRSLAQQARLRELATRDGLTGCLNHRRFQEVLRAELDRHRRAGKSLALALVDLDDFKGINDRLGHPAGDAVLQTAAGILQATVRRGDRVARYGGEEFAVILTDLPAPPAAWEAADRLRAAVAARDWTGEAGPRRPVTISVGVAAVPPHPPDPAGLIAAADTALYQAKREGKNRTVLKQTAR